MDKSQDFQLFSKKVKIFFSILFATLLLNSFLINSAQATIEEVSVAALSTSSGSGCPNSLLVENNRAYVNSYCQGKVQVFDVATQGNLALAGSVQYRDLELTSGVESFGLAETSLALNSNKLFLGASDGIFVFDVTSPTNIIKDAYFSFPETQQSEFGAAVADFAIQGNTLFALKGDSIQAIDITNTSNLAILGSIFSNRLNGIASYLENPTKIFVGGSNAFVQVSRHSHLNGSCLLDNAEQGGIAAYSIASPASIAELGFNFIDGLYDAHVDVASNVAYTLELNGSTNTIELVSYNTTSAASFSEYSRVNLTQYSLLSNPAGSLDLQGSDLFISFPQNHKILRFNVSNPSSMTLVGVISDDAMGGDATRLTSVTRLGSSSNRLFALSPKENSISEFTFSSSPTVIDPPRIVSISPSDGQNQVSTNSDIVITYDKTVTAGAGDIKIGRAYTPLNDKSGVLDEVISANSSNVTIAGSTVTVRTTESFVPGSVVQVHVDDDAFQSQQSLNSFGKVFLDGAFQVIGDTTNPKTCFLFPGDNGAILDPCNKLTLIFEELEIFKGTTGNITIRRTADNSLVEDIPVTSSNVKIDGPIVTIQPTANLGIENSLYVTIEATAFRDAAGNFFPGIASNEWTFSGYGNNAPTIQLFAPFPGQTNANFNDGIEIFFNKAVRKQTGNINIRNFSDNSLVEAIDVTTNQVYVDKILLGSVKIFPSTVLPQGSQLYIDMDNGTFVDTNNNIFAGISNNSWNFNGSYQSPTPFDINLSPEFTSYNVDLNTNLEITFSEHVVAGAGSIFIRRASDNTLLETILASSGLVTVSNNFVTINPSVNYSSENGITIDVDATAFVDADANNILSIGGWSLFANGNESILNVSQFDPAPGELLTNLNTSYIMNFSENVAKGTGNMRIYRLSDAKLLDTLAVSSDRVQVSGNQVILLPQADLSSELGIFINIDATAITNVGATKTYPGLSTLNRSWYVKVKGQQSSQGGFNGNAPQIVSFSPEPNSFNVNFAQTFSLVLNEPVAKGTGNILVRRYTNGDLLELLPVSSSNVTINGSTFQFTLTQGQSLSSESKIFIEIPSSAIVDVDSNEFPGVSAKEWVLSSVPDTEPPEVVSLMPNIADQGVDLNKNLIIEFDEPIRKINGDILIKEFTTNTTLQTIPVSSTLVDIDDNILSIDHNITVSNDATLYVQISGTSFEDLVGNDFAGFGVGEWFFTGSTQNDQQGPNAIAYNPKIGSSNNNFDEAFTIKFDEDIQIGQGFVLVKDSTNDALIAQFDVQSVFVSAQGDTLSINADTNFQGRSEIYVQVTENAVRDAAGNNFAGISDNSWNFRGSEQGDDGSGNGDNSTSNGITINVTDQVVTGRRRARLDFTVTRANTDRGTRCRASFTGIKKKRRKFRLRRGASSRIVRFTIGRKQLRKLRRAGSSVSIGIQATCRDGSSASNTMNVTL